MSRRVPVLVVSNVCGHARLVKIGSGVNELDLQQARNRPCSDCRYATATPPRVTT